MGTIHLLCSEGRTTTLPQTGHPGKWPADREGMVFGGLQRRSRSQQASYPPTLPLCQALL